MYVYRFLDFIDCMRSYFLDIIRKLNELLCKTDFLRHCIYCILIKNNTFCIRSILYLCKQKIVI